MGSRRGSRPRVNLKKNKKNLPGDQKSGLRLGEVGEGDEGDLGLGGTVNRAKRTFKVSRKMVKLYESCLLEALYKRIPKSCLLVFYLHINVLLPCVELRES